MKLIILKIFLLLSFFNCVNAQSGETDSYTEDTSASKPSKYELTLTQNGKSWKITPGIKHEITLTKAPFKLDFIFINTSYINARSSMDSHSFNTAIDKPFTDCYLGGSGGAERFSNADKHICLYGRNDIGTLSWMYHNDSMHRFDPDPVIKGDTIYATRTIEQFYTYENRKYTNCKNWSKHVYLVFFDSNKEPCSGIYGIRNEGVLPDRRYVMLKFR